MTFDGVPRSMHMGVRAPGLVFAAQPALDRGGLTPPYGFPFMLY